MIAVRPQEPPEGLDAPGRAAWAAMFGPPIAHRGLWSADKPENSTSAFEAACAAGYGIELDVRLSADGEAVVFHDADLGRMTGSAGPVSACATKALSRLRLAGSDQTLPTLAEALDVIAGRAPVLIELKTEPGAEGPLETAVARLLDGYAGSAAVIGFNPGSTAWFAAHRPQTLRGLNVDAGEVAPVLPHLVLPSLARATDADMAGLRAQGRPVIAWTARTAKQAAALAPVTDNLIFEGFRP